MAGTVSLTVQLRLIELFESGAGCVGARVALLFRFLEPPRSTEVSDRGTKFIDFVDLVVVVMRCNGQPPNLRRAAANSPSLIFA